MTRIRKTLISVLAISAATVAIGSSAIAADTSSVSSIVGGQQLASAEPSGYSSLTAIVNNGEAGKSSVHRSSLNAIMGHRELTQSGPSSLATSRGTSSLNSILGSDGAPSPSPTSPAPAGTSDGFDWRDALVGAGIALGMALTTALMLGTTRRRTRVEPSV